MTTFIQPVAFAAFAVAAKFAGSAAGLKLVRCAALMSKLSPSSAIANFAAVVVEASMLETHPVWVGAPP